MAFISQVSEDHAGPEVKPTYEKIRATLGFLPNYYRVLGRAPALLETHLAFAEQILNDGALSRKVKEQIGLVVSGINASSYCIAIHMEILRGLGVEKAIGRKLATDYASAPVEENVLALFRFADKLTRKPYEIEQPDIDALRQAGWDDAALFETVLAVALFNFVNRFSIGLGLVDDY